MNSHEHRHQVMVRVAVIVLVLAGTAWCVWEFWRLLFQAEPMGAVDLRLRYYEVNHWFAGIPAYGKNEEVPSTYPPASVVLLWPFLGWVSFTAARWIWALTSILGILAVVRALRQGSLAESKLERALIAGMVIGTYPVGATLGNGQLAIHIMACSLWSVLWLVRHGNGIERFLVVPLVLFSMTKPSSALPFIVLLLFLPGGVMPVIVTSVLYVGLTFLAAAYQPASLMSLLQSMAQTSNRLANFTGTLHYANLHVWLAELGVHRFQLIASLIVLVLFAAWLFVHRDCDIWLLLGVAAIVTRMLTYHRWYDDVLLLIPMAALFRLMKDGSSSVSQTVAEILFWCGLITMLAPGGLYVLPGILPRIYTGLETLLWLGYLVFLARACTQQRTINGLRYTGAFGFQGSSI